MTLDEAVQLATQKQQAGQTAEAESIYRQVLAADPSFTDALNLLGTMIAPQPGRLAEAVDLIARAVHYSPQTLVFHVNLGVVLLLQKRPELAVLAFRHAMALKPGDAGLHYNLGTALQSLGRLPEAIEELRIAVELIPTNAGFLAALASALADTGNWNEAIDLNRRSLSLNPNSADTHLNLAVLLLRCGQFAEGFREYEWRWYASNVEKGPAIGNQPIWNGADLSGKRILLHSEQGFGDAIQMIRYAELIHARGGTAVVHCQKDLQRLLAGAKGVAEVVPWEDAPPQYPDHCPLMSLPLAFKTELSNIPNRVPYLWADPALSKRWKARIGGEKRKKIGLVWAGQGNHLKDAQRSLSLSQLEFLLNVPTVRAFSLQKGKPVEEARGVAELTDWTGELTDFADTAALIDNLDLVITIDTSVAHLAGAMGKPTWLLLPWISDWRWLLDRTDSPWYPTVRLFRQKALDDWSVPLEEVARAIKHL